MAQRYSHEEFIEKLTIRNPSVEVKGIYDGISKPVEVKCKSCGHIWNPKASNLIVGQGCPICGRKRVTKQLYKTHEQFVLDIEKRNPTVSILGTYVSVNTTIHYKCKICGHEWNPTPNSLMNGVACPQCCHTGT